MIYTVTWDPEAEEELTRIWISSGSRGSVTKAVHRVDQLLRSNPAQAGTRHAGRLTLHQAPLLVVYEIIPDDRIVRIVQVIPETN
jgi:plasmid stabilization system protein ParE